MQFKSINPYNNIALRTYTPISKDELNSKIEKANSAFKEWRFSPLLHRTTLLKNAALLLRENTNEYAEMITLEVGKPIVESRSEVIKCAWVCDYYAENAAAFLKNEVISTDAQLSFVRHDPIGTVLAIMPWNFPFWQVFRFAAPTITAGNVGLLKHATNVLGCAELIEDIFCKAGYPTGVFQNLIIPHDLVEGIIAHKSVKAVTLTGSERAGSAVAEIAGKHLKKTVLELGGSNAFIVLPDADIDQTIKIAITARMLNSGQSCIAAKRFILIEDIYDEFVNKFQKAVSSLAAGDPMQDTTQVGPLARKDLADQLNRQVKASVNQGATLLVGGNQKGCYYEPTLLGNVTPHMTAFNEETFGPLAVMIKAKNIDHAIELAEQSNYGLGVTICTADADLALQYADRISDGAFFINELVKSDPRLPFGGTKNSGYGRELGRDGMMEFINRKTVYLK